MRRVLAVAVVLIAGACAGTPSASRRSPRPDETGARTARPVADLPRYVPVPPIFGLASPSHLIIPSIDVDTPLIPLGLEPDGSLQVPTDFAEAGWFTGGPKPGETGPAVIAGHVDSTRGPAVFFKLRDVVPGDEITVLRVDGTREDFIVDHLTEVTKQGFPTAIVFGPTELPELRLVTCTGDFDRTRHSYVDNLIVYARPAPGTSLPLTPATSTTPRVRDWP